MRPTEDARIVVSSLLLLSELLHREAQDRGKRVRALSEEEMLLTILQFAERKAFDGSKKKPGGDREL